MSALELVVTDYLSIGDYVLTGGEPGDGYDRLHSCLVPGVLNNDVSAEFESFHDNLLNIHSTPARLYLWIRRFRRTSDWHHKISRPGAVRNRSNGR